MQLISSVEREWKWTGIRPSQVVEDNAFGNLIVKDEDGRYWRLCPEDLYCNVIANDRNGLDALSKTQDFLEGWHMSSLVAEAKELLGPLKPGYRYCFKIPCVLGGEYGGKNLATITLVELIETSGHIARQIQNLPDGSQVRLQITE
ncbi:DUF1851 domain-containing protein [Pseudolysobacter antarcticus]|uniref:DUF1851 domain-containing protein n=1 Tax=Pseudolysobacter antarcticus TaxID=2511995 RepID=A0A411HMC4_9GAMM|nr:T6SS immunity protein Tdi1 domain-containing protein [Pseudolysobacter antarcticus]QBB71675.1 DUF1851 domain-containing protein [Pseudolysobacter antarcticus]